MRPFTPFRSFAPAFAGGATAWSPLALFAAGEEGAWYDPSDLTTLFQDSAGTTPVTAVEQPVGLMLDKSGNSNHASQATAAARPVLRARYNLLTYSEQFDNAAWTKSNATVSTNSAVAPDGETTADTFAQTSSIGYTRQLASSLANVTSQLTASGYAKYIDSPWVYVNITGVSPLPTAWFNIQTGAVGTETNCTATITDVGNGWYRWTATYTGDGTDSYWYSKLVVDDGSSVGVDSGSLYIWGAQLELGSTATEYQRIAAATDYDSDQSKFPWYLDCDGVDDVLTCANPDLGVDATVAFSLPGVGDSISQDQVVGANYALNTDCCGLVLLDRNLTEGELTSLTDYLNSQAGVSA